MLQNDIKTQLSHDNAHLKDFLTYDKGRLTIHTEFGKEYLTKRETEILRYILQGHSAKKIGLFLGISNRTVESYIDILKLKFRCNKKNQLISVCMEWGIFKISF